jgi:hypothetical protein
MAQKKPTAEEQAELDKHFAKRCQVRAKIVTDLL